MPEVRFELTTKTTSTFCSTNWASRAYMEISGSDPEITICKIAVLPIKLYPLVYSMSNKQLFFKALALPLACPAAVYKQFF